MTAETIAKRKGISISNRNTDVPFFPSISWELTADDYGVNTLLTFNWIQAFVDTASFSGPIYLVVQGEDDEFQSLIRFPYSGACMQFKARTILASGFDWRGNAITATPIGDNEATDIVQVIAYGGNY